MATRDISDHNCDLCAGNALKEFMNFPALPRVTSDSKPFPNGGRIVVCKECGTIQKLVDQAWLQEIDKIYGEFDIYHQAGGVEQPIFNVDGAGGRPRSVQLMEYIVNTLHLPETGSILDFGCGNGAALMSFGNLRPEWELNGCELSDATLSKLKNIPNFKQLYTSSPENIPGKFDLIILIHALEHVIDPAGTLSDLAKLLTEQGHLFVAVPDNLQTPYDLLIADHRTHFTSHSLGFAAELAGCQTVIMSDSVLPKELSWLGKPYEADQKPEITKPNAGLGLSLIDGHLTGILHQVEQARALASENTSFGIFGTSISATWLNNLLEGNVAFFVDEDRTRVGRQHMGRPVLGPEQVPQGANVFVPLIPKIATSVTQRLNRPGVTYHAPEIEA